MDGHLNPEELRALVLAAETTDARVRLIVRLMREDQWPAWPESRRFRHMLAEQWGIAESTVRNYSAEAHRQFAVDADERTEAQEQIARKMLAIADKALSMRNDMTGLPDFASAIRATESGAKFLGIEPATKVNVSGTVTLESVEELRKRVLED